MGPAERAELMLLSLDPQRGFRRLMDDLARFCTLDPKVRVAVGLLDEHFRGYSAQDREILSAACGHELPRRALRSDQDGRRRR